MQQMIDVPGEALIANGWFAAKRPALMGEDADITLDLNTLRKDMMSAVATGALAGTAMPLSTSMPPDRVVGRGGVHGWGDKDIGEPARFFREHMGQASGETVRAMPETPAPPHA
jgi:hypothetical protein